MLQNSKSNRITAIIAVAAIVFVMLFSVFFISQHVDHDCTEADCPICAVMELCVNNIKSIGTAVAVVVAALFLFVSVQKKVQYVVTVYSDYSLISQKVRMNN